MIGAMGRSLGAVRWMLAMTLSLTACASDPERRAPPPSPETAAAGPGVGKLAEMGADAYMDAQESLLRKRLRGSGVVIAREGGAILLTMPGNFTFESDAARLKPAFSTWLTGIAEVLRDFPETMIDIAGHTDAAGSERHNLRLSEARARSVRDVLLAEGVSAERIVARGLGETMPVAGNETAAGRARNRRVEMAVVPIGR